MTIVRVKSCLKQLSPDAIFQYSKKKKVFFTGFIFQQSTYSPDEYDRSPCPITDLNELALESAANATNAAMPPSLSVPSPLNMNMDSNLNDSISSFHSNKRKYDEDNTDHDSILWDCLIDICVQEDAKHCKYDECKEAMNFTQDLHWSSDEQAGY